MNTGHQLFRLVRKVPFPSNVTRDPINGKCHFELKAKPVTIAMMWPNGTPCILAEMYLLERPNSFRENAVGGGSLRDEASALSHLVRYCWALSCNFWDLRDADFQRFVHRLQTEVSRTNPNRLRRQNPRIERILAVSLNFLAWIQVNLMTDHVIVGTKDQNPQIPLEQRRIFDSRTRGFRMVLRYRYTPVPSTTQSKGPIGIRTRQQLWDAIARKGNPDLADVRYRNTFDTLDDFLFELEFLRKRRELALDILSSTGARPAEISDMAVSLNINCVVEEAITLSTVKRRKAHLRKLPITRGLAIRIELFVRVQRTRLVERQHKQSALFEPPDRVFLTVEGQPMSEATLEREFNRIAHAAGLADERACMSMYRHRFITNMVALHLKQFMDVRPGASRHIFCEDDYRTILRKVAVFTGHASVDSLLDYIDLAWDELGLYKGIDPTAILISSLEGSIASISGLVKDLKNSTLRNKGHLCKAIDEQLSALRAEIGEQLSKH